ncbi:hypothetical protein CN925_13355 [Bacillus sp. AFS055030]|nr:hypothetical protein CN925_13355 [Bacillus sp. AFS055030]
MEIKCMKVNPTKVVIPMEDQELIFEDLKEVFSSGRLTLGGFTQRFENELKELLASQYVSAVSSGSSALEIACLSLELKSKEVIIPSNTFIATPISFIRNGAIVRYADCDPHFGCITLDEIKRLHNSNTRAVVVVHIGGIIVPEILSIRDYCKKNNLLLIEDAAHAIGASLKDIQAGTFGDIGTFSLYPTKVITSGEGGIVVTKHKNLHSEFEIYRDHGKLDFSNNLHVRFGSNWRMSELHAILGYFQLKRLTNFIDARNKVALTYKSEICNERIKFVSPVEEGSTNWYKVFFILEEGIDRESFKSKLKDRGVLCGGEVY